MILINSDITDESTNLIIDWLEKYEANYKRINTNDKLIISKLEVANGRSNIELINSNDNSIINFEEVSFYWYRRGDLNIQLEKDPDEETYLKKEEEKLKEFLHYCLVNKVPSLGNFYDNYINKLIVLDTAAQFGITIPHTFITNNKKHLIEFSEQHPKIITKAIDNNISHDRGDYTSSFLTTLVKNDDVKIADEYFFYTLFQEYKEKLFEIRVFFINDFFYSSAIFSQRDDQTAVDYRNYNYEKPNRIVTYSLPQGLKNKLRRLNKKLGYNCGSMDLILTPDGQYIFLEINPVGQFGSVSKKSNYYLEHEIAKYIIKNEKKPSIQ